MDRLLYPFTQWIHTDFPTLATTTLTEIECLHWQERLKKAACRVRDQLVQQVLKGNSRPFNEFYIQTCQKLLIEQIDQLLLVAEEIPSSSANTHLVTIVNACHHELEQLLAFLERHFSAYLDPDSYVPKSYQERTIRELAEKIHTVSSWLNYEDSPVFPAQAQEQKDHLIRLITEPLTELVQTQSDLTYRQLGYYQALLKDLLQIRRDHPAPLSGEQMISLLEPILFYLNFNSYRYFTYCTQGILKKIYDEPAITRQIEVAACLRKTISQQLTHPDLVYKPKLPSLKNQLLDWLHEEIQFLERKRLLEEEERSPEPEKTDFKIQSLLSVSEIAYMIRLLLEAETMKSENTREILAFFARHTQTSKAIEISAESLRSKFYNTEDSTKKRVREILLRMVDRTYR